MKITRLINEGKLIEFDQASFEKAAYSFIKNALKKLPFNVNLDGINVTRIEKTRSPITFIVGVNILISGTNLVATYDSNQTGNQVSVPYWFYGLPGNTEITENTLRILPTYTKVTEEEYLIKRILSQVTTTNDAASRIDVYKQKLNEVQNMIDQLSKQYDVTLEVKMYPDEATFSKTPSSNYVFRVYVRDIPGCLGKFISSRPGGYYEYYVNGVSCSGFLDYKDQNLVSSTQLSDHVPLDEFDVTAFSTMIKSRLGNFIDRVKLLDYLIINDKNIENSFNNALQKLKNKYPQVKIGITRGKWLPSRINAHVSSSSFSEEFVFTLEELSTTEGISTAIAKIQRKLYKLLKSSSANMRPEVKKFIETNIDLIEDDLDEFYKLAEKQRVDLRILTHMLIDAGIDVKYTLSSIPDVIKDIV